MHKQKKKVRKAKEHENLDTLSYYIYKFYLGQADMTVIVECRVVLLQLTNL